MDRVVIDQKLESLRRCVARVMAKRPDSVAALVADAQDVIVCFCHLWRPTGRLSCFRQVVRVNRTVFHRSKPLIETMNFIAPPA